MNIRAEIVNSFRVSSAKRKRSAHTDIGLIADRGGIRRRHHGRSDFDMAIEHKPDPKGDRVKIAMSGKFLPFKYLLRRDGQRDGVWVEGGVGGERHGRKWPPESKIFAKLFEAFLTQRGVHASVRHERLGDRSKQAVGQYWPIMLQAILDFSP